MKEEKLTSPHTSKQRVDPLLSDEESGQERGSLRFGFRLRAMFRQQEGFTIQELLVVLNVSFLLVSFCLMVFLSTSKLLASWQKKQQVSEGMSRTLQRIGLDVQRSTNATLLNDSTMILDNMGQKTILYQFGHNVIWRDSVVVWQCEKVNTIISVSNDNANGFQTVDVQISGEQSRYSLRGYTQVESKNSSARIFNNTRLIGKQ